MTDPISIIGGLAAGIQLVSTTAQAVLAAIKLMRDLKETPVRLAMLLCEVEGSISRLCQSCDMGSELFQNLDLPQLNRLSQSAIALHSALREIHGILIPFAKDSKGRGRLVRNLWRSLISLKVEKELAEKLERTNRLNGEMILELGILGLEVQISTKGLILAHWAVANEASAKIEAKLDSFRNSFENFTLSTNEMHRITLDRSEDQSATPDEVSVSYRCKTIDDALKFGCSADQNIMTLSASPACSLGLEKKSRISQEQAEQMQRYLTGDTGLGPAAALMSTSQLPHANLESILFSIRTFYTLGNFDASLKIIKTKYWTDTDLAIYLMKVSTGAIRG